MRSLAVVALLVSGCADPAEPCLAADERIAEPPPTLGETGLFCAAPDDLASDAMAFAPSFELWSDGLHKRRWLYLPEGAAIDTTDTDHWSFPVGTRLWKEFADESGPIETRYAQRIGPGADDWSFVSYRWRDDGTEAEMAPAEGEPNARGTTHDIPGADQCTRCHGRTEERVLGLSAVQSSDPPGNDIERAALGYLHANCGHCHHDGDRAVPSSLRLRLVTSERTVGETAIYRSAVPEHITPGDPEASPLWLRMITRGNAQMPPVGTEHVDTRGADVVATWIRNLSPTP